jgi:Methylase involved in ubiquinone/menaquinone biosynthesis
MLERLGRKFARFTTNQVVRWPRAWPFFRWLTRAQFNRIAPAWDQRRAPEAFASLEAALDALDVSPKRALDLGTGTGRAAFLLAQRYPEAEVVGVDLAEDMLAEARKLTPPELRSRALRARRRGAALVSGRLVRPRLAREHDPVLRGAGPGHSPGGSGRFFVLGWPETPIYVPPEVLRAKLSEHGFAEFADFAAGNGTALSARKGGGA